MILITFQKRFATLVNISCSINLFMLFLANALNHGHCAEHQSNPDF